MKSIMEEASSISKAIDLAWNRAEKPSQFSIKVLEEPERNMFGLTVKSAKIALFFEETIKQEVYGRPTDRRQRPARQEPSRRPEITGPPQKRKYPEWTDELAQEAKEWLNNTLSRIGLPNIKYKSFHSGSIIKFVFYGSVTGTEGKDRLLFSSFACLILATLRNRHKKQLRNLKVILITEQ